jgi:glycosyltransferase involved in cell wall biosynthesis
MPASANDITIVMPVYNTLWLYLCACLDSLFTQTVEPHEILVVDDGTTLVQTREVLNTAEDRDLIRLITHERNLGIGAAMNTAISQCQTPFVIRFDSDDIARPKLVESHSEFLKKEIEFDVVGCQWQYIGNSDFVSNLPERVTRYYVLNSQYFVSSIGVLLNKQSILAVGGYRQIHRIAEDYELFVRMLLRGHRRFYNLPEVLVDYRDSPTGAHNQYRWWNKYMVRALKMLVRTCPEF